MNLLFCTMHLKMINLLLYQICLSNMQISLSGNVSGSKVKHWSPNWLIGSRVSWIFLSSACRQTTHAPQYKVFVDHINHFSSKILWLKKSKNYAGVRKQVYSWHSWQLFRFCFFVTRFNLLLL